MGLLQAAEFIFNTVADGKVESVSSHLLLHHAIIIHSNGKRDVSVEANGLRRGEDVRLFGKSLPSFSIGLPARIVQKHRFDAGVHCMPTRKVRHRWGENFSRRRVFEMPDWHVWIKRWQDICEQRMLGLPIVGGADPSRFGKMRRHAAHGMDLVKRSDELCANMLRRFASRSNHVSRRQAPVVGHHCAVQRRNRGKHC